MLSTKDMKKTLVGLLPSSEGVPFVIGNGLFDRMELGFDEKKLEEKKGEIASYLMEIGADELPLVSLASLTKLKDGSTWNNLNTLEDFQALELLVAVSDASGFIINNDVIRQMNINEVGNDSILLTLFGKMGFETDEEWVAAVKESIVDHMFFFTDSDAIRLNAPEDPAKGPVRSRKTGRR